MFSPKVRPSVASAKARKDSRRSPKAGGLRDWSDRDPRVLLFDGHALEASLSALDAFPNAVSILDAGSWREGTATLAGKVDYLAASERFALQATGLQDLHTSEHRRHALSVLREL